MLNTDFDPTIELDRLCELITLSRKKGVTYRYTDEVKNKVKQLKNNGVSIPLICARSGINMKSIYHWTKKQKSKSKTSFKTFNVSEPSGIEIKLPNGTVIKGLSISDVKELFSHALSQ